MSQVSLRPASDADLATLASLLSELDGDVMLPLHTVRDTWQAIREVPGYECYLAEIDGAVVGTLSMIIFPVFSQRAANKEAIVEAVVIKRSMRSQGIGRAMLQAAMNIAAAQGAYKLALSSNMRRTDAHRFYQTVGFAQHGLSFSIDTQQPPSNDS